MAWTEFVDSTTAQASEVNGNFDFIEGDLVPHLAGSLTTDTYKLGTSSARWLELNVLSINAGSIEMSGSAYMAGGGMIFTGTAGSVYGNTILKFGVQSWLPSRVVDVASTNYSGGAGSTVKIFDCSDLSNLASATALTVLDIGAGTVRTSTNEFTGINIDFTGVSPVSPGFASFTGIHIQLAPSLGSALDIKGTTRLNISGTARPMPSNTTYTGAEHAGEIRFATNSAGIVIVNFYDGSNWHAIALSQLA